MTWQHLNAIINLIAVKTKEHMTHEATVVGTSMLIVSNLEMNILNSLTLNHIHPIPVILNPNPPYRKGLLRGSRLSFESAEQRGWLLRKRKKSKTPVLSIYLSIYLSIHLSIYIYMWQV